MTTWFAEISNSTMVKNHVIDMFWAFPRRGMRGQRNNSLRAQPSGEGPGIENKLQTEMKLNNWMKY